MTAHKNARSLKRCIRQAARTRLKTSAEDWRIYHRHWRNYRVGKTIEAVAALILALIFVVLVGGCFFSGLFLPDNTGKTSAELEKARFLMAGLSVVALGSTLLVAAAKRRQWVLLGVGHLATLPINDTELYRRERHQLSWIGWLGLAMFSALAAVALSVRYADSGGKALIAAQAGALLYGGAAWCTGLIAYAYASTKRRYRIAFGIAGCLVLALGFAIAVSSDRGPAPTGSLWFDALSILHPAGWAGMMFEHAYLGGHRWSWLWGLPLAAVILWGIRLTLEWQHADVEFGDIVGVGSVPRRSLDVNVRKGFRLLESTGPHSPDGPPQWMWWAHHPAQRQYQGHTTKPAPRCGSLFREENRLAQWCLAGFSSRERAILGVWSGSSRYVAIWLGALTCLLGLVAGVYLLTSWLELGGPAANVHAGGNGQRAAPQWWFTLSFLVLFGRTLVALVAEDPSVRQTSWSSWSLLPISFEEVSRIAGRFERRVALPSYLVTVPFFVLTGWACGVDAVTAAMFGVMVPTIIPCVRPAADALKLALVSRERFRARSWLVWLLTGVAGAGWLGVGLFMLHAVATGERTVLELDRLGGESTRILGTLIVALTFLGVAMLWSWVVWTTYRRWYDRGALDLPIHPR